MEEKVVLNNYVNDDQHIPASTDRVQLPPHATDTSNVVPAEPPLSVEVTDIVTSHQPNNEEKPKENENRVLPIPVQLVQPAENTAPPDGSRLTSHQQSHERLNRRGSDSKVEASFQPDEAHRAEVVQTESRPLEVRVLKTDTLELEPSPSTSAPPTQQESKPPTDEVQIEITAKAGTISQTQPIAQVEIQMPTEVPSKGTELASENVAPRQSIETNSIITEKDVKPISQQKDGLEDLAREIAPKRLDGSMSTNEMVTYLMGRLSSAEVICGLSY